jgi:hypothetical protein
MTALLPVAPDYSPLRNLVLHAVAGPADARHVRPR